MTNETELRSRLDQAASRLDLQPLDPAPLVQSGARARRRRSFRRTLTAVGGVTVAAVVLGSLVLGPGSGASPYFGDPGDRYAAVASGGAQDGYPDLVVSRVGSKHVSIDGFGWPIEGQAVVSDPNGDVSFPDIDQLDAETMCLPMLEQAAPRVPASRWRHSEGWIDGFPTRAGLVTTFEADYQGRTFYASCTLPGDYTPARRPNLAHVPSPSDAQRLLADCSYLGHVDLNAWRVATTSSLDGAIAAAVVAPDGTLARCVLSPDIAQRQVQLSSLGASSPLIYDQVDGVVSMIGRTDPSVARLVVRSENGAEHTVKVVDGWYADLYRAGEPTQVTAYDASGEPVEIDPSPLPSVCFTSVETNNDGC